MPPSLFKRVKGFFGTGTESAGPLAVAGFGKHPGWDDHVDNLGQLTPALAEVRRALYIDGIGGNIDSGAWDKLPDAHRLNGFAHNFVWHLGKDIIVGRIWSSKDGKGRSRYPMIVCVHGATGSAGDLIEKSFAMLSDWEARFRSATSETQAREAMREAQAELASLTLKPDDFKGIPDALATLAPQIDLGASGLGVLAVLYHVDRELGAYVSGKSEQSRLARPSHLRAPAGAGSVSERATLWTRFFTRSIKLNAPFLLLFRDDTSWIDVIAGSPSATQIFCLCASPAAVPLVTDIPWNLPEDFIVRSKERIAAAQASSVS